MLVLFDFSQVIIESLHGAYDRHSSGSGKLKDTDIFELVEQGLCFGGMSCFFNHDILRLYFQDAGIVLPDQVLYLIAIAENMCRYLVKGNFLEYDLLGVVVESFEHIHLFVNLRHKFLHLILGHMYHDRKAVDTLDRRFGGREAFDIDMPSGKNRNHPGELPGLVFDKNGDGKIFGFHVRGLLLKGFVVEYDLVDCGAGRNHGEYIFLFFHADMQQVGTIMCEHFCNRTL